MVSPHFGQCVLIDMLVAMVPEARGVERRRASILLRATPFFQSGGNAKSIKTPLFL
jgi:hypothetical protein